MEASIVYPDRTEGLFRVSEWSRLDGIKVQCGIGRATALLFAEHGAKSSATVDKV